MLFCRVGSSGRLCGRHLPVASDVCSIPGAQRDCPCLFWTPHEQFIVTLSHGLHILDNQAPYSWPHSTPCQVFSCFQPLSVQLSLPEFLFLLPSLHLAKSCTLFTAQFGHLLREAFQVLPCPAPAMLTPEPTLLPAVLSPPTKGWRLLTVQLTGQNARCPSGKGPKESRVGEMNSGEVGGSRIQGHLEGRWT